MILLRECLAFVVFILGLICAYDLLTDDFSWLLLCMMILSFLCAFLVWPSKKKGQRDQGSFLIDILEFIIELPVEAFIWFFRMLGRLFGGKGDGIDLDL